jgi:hypothetical protein
MHDAGLTSTAEGARVRLSAPTGTYDGIQMTVISHSLAFPQQLHAAACAAGWVQHLNAAALPLQHHRMTGKPPSMQRNTCTT